LLGKAFAVTGFFLLVVALLFWGSSDQWVASFSFVVGVFFLVLGWVVGTEQLVDTSLPCKVGVLMVSFAISSLAISTVCSCYCEIGGVVRETEIFQRFHRTGETKFLELMPITKQLYFKPYAWLFSPLGTFGAGLLTFGLLLKLFCRHIGHSRLMGHRLAHRRSFALTLALLFVGISFLLFDCVWSGYTNAYAEFMTCRFIVPPSIGSHVISGHSLYLEKFEEFVTSVDFVFTPWLNCRLENCVSVPSANNITFSVFADDASEPVVNVTSSEIRYSQNLQAKVQYTFRIRNTVNQTFSVAMSTKIERSTDQRATLIGATLTLTCAATTIVLTEKELKAWNQKSKKPHQRTGETSINTSTIDP